MIRRPGLAFAVAALAALAGCNKKADESTTAPAAEGALPPGEVPAAQAPVPTAPGAPALPPKRKAGLWEQTVSTGGMTQTSRLCVNAAVEEKLGWWSQQATQDRCAQTDFKPGAGGWTFSSTCDLGAGGKTVTKGVATGDFSSAYQMDMTSTTTGSTTQHMNGEHKMTMKAAWKGPCPADMRPGDMILTPGGMKMNLLDGAPAR
jgi:hypothetical protein